MTPTTAPFPELLPELQRLTAPLPIWRGAVDAARWSALADAVADGGGRLISVWAVARGASMAVCAAYGVAPGLVWVELELEAGADAAGAHPAYPDLAARFPCAARMQRALADLSGPRASGQDDRRPWLDHGLWGAGSRPLAAGGPPAGAPLATLPVDYPLVRGEGAGAPLTTLPADYPFVRVEGDGVHEIAVGPVHAGIIEPGHFRFSVVGEKVLRLEQHLGYLHKGIERRFTELAAFDAYRLAGRISGDTTVAYAWAYAMALESAWGCAVPVRARWLRALMLERERVANHLGDLGALGNDAALGFGLAQFSRLREDWLRLSAEVFGHRLMMDCIVPGGVAVDVARAPLRALAAQCDGVEREVLRLRQVYDEHAGLQDRFLTTGRVTPELAQRLGLTGLAGRASGIARDLRCDPGWEPYPELKVKIAGSRDGDVAARVAVRFDELLESLRLMLKLCSALPGGATRLATAAWLAPGAAAVGAGWVEGWRGEVLIALETGDDGRIVRCHAHDPSWQNWPVLEHAVIGNIVPDFPLINKSFNLSYSGVDL